MSSNPNENIIKAWDTILFEKFLRYEHVLVNGLGAHGDKIFEKYPPAKGARVLDVGCGLGDTCVKLAELVGSEGSVVGVDCSQNFIRASSARCQRAGVGNASFLVADVQNNELGEGFDAVFSRFGTMFFTFPVAAFRRLHAAMKPGARFCMSVWRKRQDNPCFFTAQETVERFVKKEDQKTEGAITCGPGPFSLAGPDMVSDMLLSAGFDDVTFTRFDAPLCIGHSLEEALSFAKELGPAGEALRLAREKAADRMGEIEAALKEALDVFKREDGTFWAMSSTWLISCICKK